jgi:hypothetical protein
MPRQVVSVRNPNDGKPLSVTMPEASEIVAGLNALVPMQYDEIKLDYDKHELSQVTFTLQAQTICTIELFYRDGNLVKVIRK